MVSKRQNSFFHFFAVFIRNFASLCDHTAPRIQELHRSGDDVDVNDDNGPSKLFLAAEKGTNHIGEFCVLFTK